LRTREPLVPGFWEGGGREGEGKSETVFCSVCFKSFKELAVFVKEPLLKMECWNEFLNNNL
jgi:hypothetical protein